MRVEVDADDTSVGMVVVRVGGQIEYDDGRWGCKSPHSTSQSFHQVLWCALMCKCRYCFRSYSGLERTSGGETEAPVVFLQNIQRSSCFLSFGRLAIFARKRLHSEGFPPSNTSYGLHLSAATITATKTLHRPFASSRTFLTKATVMSAFLFFHLFRRGARTHDVAVIGRVCIEAGSHPVHVTFFAVPPVRHARARCPLRLVSAQAVFRSSLTDSTGTPWRCPVCGFDNRPLCKHCDLCGSSSEFAEVLPPITMIDSSSILFVMNVKVVRAEKC